DVAEEGDAVARDEGDVAAGERLEDYALVAGDPAQAADDLLGVEDALEVLGVGAMDDLVLEVLDPGADLVHDGQVIVDEPVEHAVQDPDGHPWPVAGLAHVAVQLGDRAQRRARVVGDDVALADEDVELEGVDDEAALDVDAVEVDAV